MNTLPILTDILRKHGKATHKNSISLEKRLLNYHYKPLYSWGCGRPDCRGLGACTIIESLEKELAVEH